jgi:hypothetical protein
MLQAYAQRKSVYQKAIPLAPGNYRLNVVCKDKVGGNLINYEAAISVPRMDPEKIASSTLVLADVIESVPARSIGTGPFVVGSWRVRPRVDEVFKRDEKLGIFLKLFNFSTDEVTRKPNGQIQYELTKNGSNEKILDFTEELADRPDASASQVTIEYFYPLNKLAPGQYTLRLKITDKTKNQVITPSAQFTVT